MGPSTGHPHPEPPMQQADAAPHAAACALPGRRLGLALRPDRGGHLGAGGAATPSLGKAASCGHRQGARGMGRRVTIHSFRAAGAAGGEAASEPQPAARGRLCVARRPCGNSDQSRRGRLWPGVPLLGGRQPFTETRTSPQPGAGSRLQGSDGAGGGTGPGAGSLGCCCPGPCVRAGGAGAHRSVLWSQPPAVGSGQRPTRPRLLPAEGRPGAGRGGGCPPHQYREVRPGWTGPARTGCAQGRPLNSSRPQTLKTNRGASGPGPGVGG